ncbi:hypothetical protein ACHAW5_005227 [Stephanodiscus triporus]|uniref:Uncharacterized protein n=1 Tax=Stephanodiscus triporus TaxID=2934178 RepID=A0ABD3Q5L9_9STRA
METPRDVVVGLARWYCANARPHFAKSTATPPANRPCRRRRLRDITAPNLLSHVVVKVLRCERANSASREVVTHVALSDGSESDDLLGMVGASTRGGRRGVVPGSVPSIPWSISSVLLRSMEDGSRVLLTHALSRSSTGGLGGAPSHDRGSLILVPTAETTASILAPDHPYYVHSNITGGVGEDPFALQLVSVMSQQHGHCRGVIAVEAPLMDIIVDGIPTSFMEGSHWQTPCLLSRFLIDHPSISTGFQALDLPSSYRSATLILDPISLACDIMINADGDAMKLICMDVPVEDMVFDATIVTPNPYLSHVGDLLKALCTEKVPIRWILEQESEYGWFVTNATLLNISN